MYNGELINDLHLIIGSHGAIQLNIIDHHFVYGP